MKKNYIISVSGGIDSFAVYTFLKNQKNTDKILLVNFDYGAKNNAQEKIAINKLYKNEELITLNMDLSFLKKSSLMNKSNKIPNNDDIKSTVVNFRNGIILSYLTSIAEEYNIFNISLGINAPAYLNYPDCNNNFIQKFEESINLGTLTQEKINIILPLITLDKIGIFKLLKKNKITYKKLKETYSCYRGNAMQCNDCPPCIKNGNASLQVYGKNYLKD